MLGAHTIIWESSFTGSCPAQEEIGGLVGPAMLSDQLLLPSLFM